VGQHSAVPEMDDRQDGRFDHQGILDLDGLVESLSVVLDQQVLVMKPNLWPLLPLREWLETLPSVC